MAISIFLNGGGEFAESAKADLHHTYHIDIACLPGGMSSGLPSVAIRLTDGDLHFIGEISMRELFRAVEAMKVRFGELKD